MVGSTAAKRVGHIEVEPPRAVDRPFPNLGPDCRAAAIPNSRSPSGKGGSAHLTLFAAWWPCSIRYYVGEPHNIHHGGHHAAILTFLLIPAAVSECG